MRNPVPITERAPTDAEIAEKLRKAAGELNHWCHVALYHGLFVQLTTTREPMLRISDVCVMRPILPQFSTDDDA